MMYLRTRDGANDVRLPLPSNYNNGLIEMTLRNLYGQGMVVSWPKSSSDQYGLYLVNDGSALPMSKIFYLSDF